MVTIKNERYPAFLTMGAMLRYREETGEEVSTIKDGDMAKLVTWMWCAVRGACSRQKRDFDMTLTEFADNVSPKQVREWFQDEVMGPSGFGNRTDRNEEKKSPSD